MISWSEIEAEAQGFRQGLVALYRKYEGQDTDEKDAQGRTVKVTTASFARHMGVAERSFHRWTKKQDGQTGRPGPLDPGPLDPPRVERSARQIARQAPQAIVTAISELPEAQQVEIMRQVRERRRPDPAPLPEADRKAVRAETHALLEPVKDALRQLKRVGVADIIRQCAEDIREGSWDDEDRADIDDAVDELLLARTEMHMRHEAEL